MLEVTENTIEELTRMLIKEDFESKSKDKQYFKMTKLDLIKFCIKLMKVVNKEVAPRC